MTREELVDLFQEYLNREPKEDEFRLHQNKKITRFRNEIANCEERQLLIKSEISVGETHNSKIAVLLCGHIRKNSILHSIINLSQKQNIDVFVFAWDNIGLKGSETNLNDEIKSNVVESEIKKIPKVIRYEIQNNKNFINSLGESDVTYFNFSSPEVFIKSQLYSVKKCYELFESYVKETGIEYSVVLKSRFDLEITDFNITAQTVKDMNENKIIFVPNSSCHHIHPDHSTSCWVCDKMYYTHNLKRVHIFEHSNIICDVFAYGSISSMKDYCLLYDYYDELNRSFVEGNLKSIEKNKIDYKINKNVYELNVHNSHGNHLNSLYYVNCSYPERLLQKHLWDYMLVESKNIKMKFKR